MAVWISGYLTFLSILFTFDAFFFFGGSNSLLSIYPIYSVVRGIFGDISAATYIWLTSISTFVLFGITVVFLCEDPFTVLMKKIASESQSEKNQNDSSFEPSLSTLEMINHSLTQHNIDLNEVKNGLHDLTDSMKAMKIKMTRLAGKLANVEREASLRMECASCGNKILPEFRLCPYCGKELFMYGNVPAVIRQ